MSDEKLAGALAELAEVERILAAALGYPDVNAVGDHTPVTLAMEAARVIRELRDAQPRPPAPDWSQAPEDVQWWSVDMDGTINLSKDEPEAYDLTGKWENYYGTMWYGGRVKIPLGIDWRTLKQRRPEAA